MKLLKMTARVNWIMFRKKIDKAVKEIDAIIESKNKEVMEV